MSITYWIIHQFCGFCTIVIIKQFIFGLWNKKSTYDFSCQMQHYECLFYYFDDFTWNCVKSIFTSSRKYFRITTKLVEVNLNNVNDAVVHSEILDWKFKCTLWPFWEMKHNDAKKLLPYRRRLPMISPGKGNLVIASSNKDLVTPFGVYTTLTPTFATVWQFPKNQKMRWCM